MDLWITVLPKLAASPKWVDNINELRKVRDNEIHRGVK
jgi:hypothetical protein